MKTPLDPNSNTKQQRFRLFPHRSTVDGMSVLKNPIEHRRIGKDDETEASRSSGELFPHNHSQNHLAVVLEVLLQLLLRCLP